jgi:hypothetical protein
MKAEVKTTVEK